MPAAAYVEVARMPGDREDRTLLMAHVSRRAIAQVEGFTARLLEGRLGNPVSFADNLPPSSAGADALAGSLRVLAKRAHYINVAITLCVISALLVSLVVILLFANAFLRVNLQIAIAVMFVASMSVLTGAFMAFLIEVRLATASLRIGVPY
jgi:hypothetical protein